MERCTRCILPHNYPGVVFDEKGVCNYCLAHESREYLGDEALKEKIESFLSTKADRNDNYDCILTLSGGRDSSYLLYYLVRVLNLKVLAYSIDNGFVPKQTKLNLENMVDILGVELVIERNKQLEKCIRHHILSFIHKPSAPMIGLICTGCRLGMDVKIPDFVRNSGVPVVISGANPLDAVSFKTMIMAHSFNSGSKLSFFLGYLFQIMKNLKWIRNYTCLTTQIREYYHHFFQKSHSKGELLGIAPFYSYTKWDEDVVVSTIKDELGWRETPGAGSTWRGDCEIALLKLYLYRKMLGFNDRDEGLSYLIRDSQMSREEALNRLEKEHISNVVVENILGKLGLDFGALTQALSTDEVLFASD